MIAYPIPAAAFDDRLGFVGTSGSGKTYNAGSAVEKLLRAKARVVILDALDVWWGLRSDADGKAASGFNLPIFGGPHGDLPINEHAGALIGETVAGMAESCIVSLKGMPSDAAARRFVLAFLKALYAKHRGGLFHLVIDEADLWVPQMVMDRDGDAMKLKGLVSNIVRRGRVDGFIPWLITQRPAVIAKDVLSQVDGLISFKLTSSQDRDALGGWIDGQADRETGKAILASLPTLPVGTGVVWLPGRGILETSAFPLKITFDSSRAPKRGEERRDAKVKALDLGKLQAQLATVEAEAKANDPAALRAEVSRLTRELAAKPKGGIDADALGAACVDAEKAGFERGLAEGIRRGTVSGQAIMLGRAQGALNALRIDEAAVSISAPSSEAAKRDTAPAKAASPPVQRQPTRAPVPRQSEGSAAVTGPQRRVLDALAWWLAFGIQQPTNEQVGFIAAYSPSSGGFANLKGGLRGLGLVEYPAGGRLALTPEGEAIAVPPAMDVTRDAFHAQVRAKLTGPQVKVLDPILVAYPDPITSLEVAEIASYSASSGGFANLRGSLRTIGLIDYPAPGQVRAADWLFPESGK